MPDKLTIIDGRPLTAKQQQALKQFTGLHGCKAGAVTVPAVSKPWEKPTVERAFRQAVKPVAQRAVPSVAPLPCPFCGGPANITRNEPSPPELEKPWFGVSCLRDKVCTVGPMAFGYTRADAVAAWNERAERSLLLALVFCCESLFSYRDRKFDPLLNVPYIQAAVRDANRLLGRNHAIAKQRFPKAGKKGGAS